MITTFFININLFNNPNKSWKLIIIYRKLFSCFFYFLFFIFLSPLNLKIKKNKKGTHFSLGHQEPFSERCLPARESLKSPIFLCYSQISILAGTNLIMLLLIFFLQPPFDSQENPSPFDFRENSSSFDFRENPFKTPKENQKNCFSFAPCVFWICFRGLFAVVPLDLNFTNPKSTIFEPGWKTQLRGLDW